MLAGLGTAVAAAGLLVLGGTGSCACTPPAETIVMIIEKTDRVPGLIPEQVRGRALELAERGGGRLVTYVAGRTVAPVGQIDLRIMRGGEIEGDAGLRRLQVAKRLAALDGAINRARAGDSGFDLFAAFQAAEDAAAGRPADVTLATTVLSSSVAPLDMAALTAADPKRAVEEAVKGPLRTVDLTGVVLRPVLLTPAGTDQEPLSPASEAWREDFIVQLGTALGATVKPAVRDRGAGAPWASPAAVPAIPSIDLAEPAERPAPPDAPRFDAAYFRPDEATLLNPSAVRDKIEKVAGRYATAPAGSVVHVTGYCAKFGTDATGARALSRSRAQVIAGLLAKAGIPRMFLKPDGKGWDIPADPGKPATDRAQRVVVVAITPPRTR